MKIKYILASLLIMFSATAHAQDTTENSSLFQSLKLNAQAIAHCQAVYKHIYDDLKEPLSIFDSFNVENADYAEIKKIFNKAKAGFSFGEFLIYQLRLEADRNQLSGKTLHQYSSSEFQKKFQFIGSFYEKIDKDALYKKMKEEYLDCNQSFEKLANEINVPVKNIDDTTG